VCQVSLSAWSDDHQLDWGELGVPVNSQSVGFLKNYTSDPPSYLHFQEAPRGRWHQWHRDWFSIRIRYLLISLTGWDPSAVYVCILCLLFLTQFSEEAELQKFTKKLLLSVSIFMRNTILRIVESDDSPSFLSIEWNKRFLAPICIFLAFQPPTPTLRASKVCSDQGTLTEREG